MTVERRSRWRIGAAALVVAGLAASGATAADSPLADAAERGDRGAVRRLLDRQVDVDAAQGDGATALHWAVYRDDIEMSASLIEAGARVDLANNYGVTPFALAARNGSAAILGQLLAAGSDPNDPRHAVNASETPLMVAARSGQADAVEVLLDAGADIDAQESWNGQSALMWAAAEAHDQVVALLVARGAGIAARSNSGATPLLFAARKGSRVAV